MEHRAEHFLQSIASIAAGRKGLRVAGSVQRLWGKYWSYEQILSGLPLRSDWNVEENYVPFFGDWHEVICLSLLDGRVVRLDNRRNIVYSWSSPEEFVASITDAPPDAPLAESPPAVKNGLSSPELKAKAEAFLRAQRDKT